ncbi:hypothetical protein V8C44DRAFT_60031 [Trichoderma aethiopicum]
MWCRTLLILPPGSHGVHTLSTSTPGPNDTQIYAQGDICGILLCISGRQSIDLGGICWVMVAAGRYVFSQLHGVVVWLGWASPANQHPLPRCS